MSKHTLGPWERGQWAYALAFRNNAPEDHIVRVNKWGGPTIAICDTEAHARMISELPNLLKQLESCVETLEYLHQTMGRHNCTVDCPDIGKTVAWARDAIAKATGGEG